MTTKINRQWRLAARPEGFVKESDFEWREEPAPTPGEGQLLVRIGWMSSMGWRTRRARSTSSSRDRMWASSSSQFQTSRPGTPVESITSGAVA